MSETLEIDGLASEYVLGVLDAPALRALAARAHNEPDFGARVLFWENRLAPLAMLVPPVAPPEALWPRLRGSVDKLRPAPLPFRRPGGSVRLWQVATAAALAMAATFAAIAFLPRPPQASTVAALAPLGSPAPAFILRALPGGRLQLVALGGAAVPVGRDLQLWALQVGATKPVSLGVLPAGGTIIAAGPLTEPGGKLLISLEPKGGSTTGQPTGKVLYGGTITRV